MPHAVTMPSTGLQALILCGPGSSFSTFTSNPDENPKALLPIANRPMVWYPIDFCYRMGITDITLISPPSAAETITTALNTNPFLTGLPSPRPTILAPPSLDQNTGTAEILRLPEVRAVINKDLVVLPCDIVCELSGSKLLQAWMIKAASITDILGTSKFSDGSQPRYSGGLGVWYDTKSGLITKGEETDLVTTAPLNWSASASSQGSIFRDVSNLVHSMPKDSLNDLMEEKNALPIRHSLLKAHPRIRMLTSHRDAHIYILPQWILEFIKENEKFESISEDVIGWWAKAKWQKGLAQKLQFDSVCGGRSLEEDNTSNPESVTSGRDLGSQQHIPTGLGKRSLNTLDQGKPPRDLEANAHQPLPFEVPPILAYIPSNHDQNSTCLIRRVDNAQLLLSVSLQIAKLPSLEETVGETHSPFAHARKVTYPEGVKPRTTITKADSLVGESVTVEAKTSIKESVIGANCQINEGAKLSQCLLMDGVIVGKGCKLTKCILGKRCVIGDDSILTECEVQENLLVEARTEDKNNKLMSSEGLEATEAEMEEVLQEQDDGYIEDGGAITE